MEEEEIMTSLIHLPNWLCRAGKRVLEGRPVSVTPGSGRPMRDHALCSSSSAAPGDSRVTVMASSPSWRAESGLPIPERSRRTQVGTFLNLLLSTFDNDPFCSVPSVWKFAYSHGTNSIK